MIPLDGWSVRRRDLYLRIHTQDTEELETAANDGPQTHVLERSATGIGTITLQFTHIYINHD